MDTETALKILTGIALEYVGTLADRAATQEALLLRIQAAHGVLTNSLAHAPPPQAGAGSNGHDGDPA